MTYRRLLAENPAFRTLWLVNLVSSFGSWFSTVAVYTLLIRFDAPATVIALAAALHWLPGILQAPLTGVLIDRVAPKKLMLVLLAVELAATLLYLSVTGPEYVWLLLALIFFRMGAASFFFTTMQSTVPKLVTREQLRLANDITSVTWSLTFVFGMGLGGVAVEWLGVSAAILLDSLTFFASLYWVATIRFPAHTALAVAKASRLLKEGWRYLRGHPSLGHLILLHATVGFTSFDALVTLLAKNYYADVLSEPLAIGLINAVRAVGLAIGPFIFLRFRNPKSLLTWLFIGQGTAILFWALFQYDFYAALPGLFLTGLFTTSIWSLTYSLIQTQADNGYQGRVIAYNDMAFLAMNAAVALLIGALADHGLSLEAITLLLGSLFLVAAGYYLLVRKRIFG